MEQTVEDLEREEIKKYLLGRMDDAGREGFEQRVITDPDYKDAVFLGGRYWLNGSEADWSVAFRDAWGRLNDPQSPPTQSSSAAPFTLTPTLTRSGREMPRVEAPAGAESVQVQLRLPPEQYPSYRVTLRPVDGKETFPLPPLPPQTVGGNRVLLLNVPVKLLPRGDYELQLSGVGAGGTSVNLDSYNFRLVR